MVVWHRRAGKDDVCLHWSAVKAIERPATYWHMLPEAAQARKAIWDAVNPHTGRKRIDEAFPAPLRRKTVNDEMKIEFRNGSMWQVVGSDNYNSLVGSAPAGIIFSEWALADPQAWAYMRPILRENNGWALFITTPRGRNHAKTFFDEHKNDPDWFVQRLTARDTGVFSEEALAEERGEYIKEFGEQDGDSRFRQEYLCDFDAAVVGAYYGSEMNRAETDNRITAVPWQPGSLVHTAWDIGVGDSTAIWFCQRIGREWHIIDYLENSGVGVEWYAKELRAKPYAYGEHIWPHDGEQREFTSGGLTRAEVANGLGIRPRILPRENPEDGISAVRQILPACWFDAEKCKRGIEALRMYRREWNEKLKVFNDRPLHDWASHGADAFRYLALGNPTSNDAWSKPLDYRPRRLA